MRKSSVTGTLGIDLAWEAQLHREVSSALFKSALQTPGDKEALARRVGISPQYLSYLQNTYDERTADPQLAKKICAALPLEPEQRESLFEHLILANQRRLEAKRRQRMEFQQRPLEDIADVLGQLHHQAGTASDPLVSRHNYQIVRDTAREALGQLPLPARPLLVAQLCFLVHDTQCVLNRPDDALYHAKLARVILEQTPESRFQRERESLDRLSLQAINAEAVAYHNLELSRQAYESYLEGETTRSFREQPAQWGAYLLRGKLAALSRRSRFTLSEAEGIADQARAIFERRDDPIDPLWLFLTRESLARAYIRYGNLPKATRVLEGQLDKMHQISFIGPLHRAIFLSTAATLHWKLADRAGWEYFIRRVLTIALQAGLVHQIDKMRQAYGPALEPLLAE